MDEYDRWKTTDPADEPADDGWPDPADFHRGELALDADDPHTSSRGSTVSKLNPPAFPRPAFYPDDPADHMEPGERMEWSHGAQAGMELRDYFAAHALGGYLAIHCTEGEDYPAPKTVAAACYGYADALLAERNKPPVLKATTPPADEPAD